MADGFNLELDKLIDELKDVLDWFSLGLRLGIKYEELKKIELDYKEHGVERYKIEMLRFWLNNDSKASYRKLVKALANIDHRNLAKTLRLKYCKTDTVKDSKSKLGMKVDRIKYTISQQDSYIMEEYAQFMTQLQKLLIKKEVAVNNIILYFVCLEREYEHVINATDIRSFMIKLRRTQSWLNFDTTARIACAFCQDEGVKLVEKYEAKLKVHLLKRITLSLPEVRKAKDVVVKINEKRENFTQERIDKFTRTVAKLLQLEREDFVFLNVEDGCVKLTYLIPSSLVSHVKDALHGLTGYLEENGVISVNIDGESIWLLSQEEESSSKRKGEEGTPKSKRFKFDMDVSVMSAPQKSGRGQGHPKPTKKLPVMRSFPGPVTHDRSSRSVQPACVKFIHGCCMNIVRKKKKLCVTAVLLILLIVLLYTIHGSLVYVNRVL